MGKMIGIIAALSMTCIAGCATVKENPITAKVAEQPSLMMVESQHHTDQFLMELFRQTDAIYITDGRGGELDGMLETLDYLDQNPEKLVVIDGDCYSACTLLLAKPRNVIFTDNASFFFHSASVRYCVDGNVKTTLSAPGNEKMRAALPPKVTAWVDANKAFDSTEFTEMPASDARELLPYMYVESEKLPGFRRTGEYTTTKDTSNIGRMTSACK